MKVIITDREIAALIKERKIIPKNNISKFTKRKNRGSNEHILNITGEEDNKFQIIVRVSISNNRNFSVILCAKAISTKKLFHLKRYNNNCHQHTNTIEDEEISGFHIHTATERYQVKGKNEDSYAEPTRRYSDVNKALKCLFTDANIEDLNRLQDTLFEGGVNNDN